MSPLLNKYETIANEKAANMEIEESLATETDSARLDRLTNPLPNTAKAIRLLRTSLEISVLNKRIPTEKGRGSDDASCYKSTLKLYRWMRCKGLPKEC